MGSFIVYNRLRLRQEVFEQDGHGLTFNNQVKRCTSCTNAISQVIRNRSSIVDAAGSVTVCCYLLGRVVLCVVLHWNQNKSKTGTEAADHTCHVGKFMMHIDNPA